MDFNKGLSVEELDKLIGKRDYREFLNTRNEMYRERGMKENPPVARRSVAVDVRESEPDQAADSGEGQSDHPGF